VLFLSIKDYLIQAYRKSEYSNSSVAGTSEDITNFGVFKHNNKTKGTLVENTAILQETSDLITQKRSSNRIIIDRKEQHIKILKNKLRQKGSNKAEIASRIERLKHQRSILGIISNSLRLEQAAAEDIGSATNIINIVTNNINKAKTFEELSELLDSLSIAGNYIDTWQGLRQLFNYNVQELLDRVNRLAADLDDLQQLKIETSKRILLRIANEFSYDDGFTEDNLFAGQKDTGAIAINVLSTRHSTVNLVKIAHSLLNDMTAKLNEEYYFKHAEITNRIKRLEKATGLTGTALWENFIQKRKNGEWTKNYLGKYSQEYYDKLMQLSTDARGKKNWKLYWDFVRKNTKEITESMILGKERGYFSDKQVEMQAKLYEEYQEDFKAFKEALHENPNLFTEEGEFVSNDSAKQYHSFVSSWQMKHSPIQALRARQGKIRFQKGMVGTKYIVSPEPIDKWIDPRYTQMRANPEMSSFYDFMVETFHDNNGLLPSKRGKVSNYLPELTKSFAEQISDGNYAKLLGKLHSDAIKAIYAQPESLIETKAELGGKEINFIPVHMMNDMLDEDQKSFNIGKILLAHTALSLGYKQKSAVLPTLNSILDLLSLMKEGEQVQVGSDFIPKEDIHGEILESTRSLTNAKQHLVDTMKAMIYNDFKNTNNILKHYTPSEQKEVNAIKAKLEQGDLDAEESLELKNRLSELGKSYNLNTASDSLITYTYVLGLGFPNIISPAVNMIYGLFSNFTYSAGEKYITDGNMMKGMMMMMGAVSRRAVTKADKKNLMKVYGFMDRFGLLSHIIEIDYGGVKKVANALVTLQSKAEYINQGSLVIGMLKTLTLKDKNGKNISIWDAFTLDDNNTLIWDKTKMADLEVVASKELMSEDKKSLNIIKLAKLVNSVVASVHGDYESVMIGKRKAWFRHLALFKTWLPETINHRFGKLTKNPDTGDWEKGRYLSFVSSVDKNGNSIAMGKSLLDTITNLYKISPKNGFKMYSEIDQINLARNVREMQFILLMTAVAVLLNLLINGDDDDKEHKKLLTMVFNMLNKSRADLMFYLNPKAALNTFNNLIPTVSTMARAASVVEIALDMIQGNGTVDSGPMKGMNKLGRWGLQMTPGAAGAIKMANSMSKKYDYN